MAQKPVKHENCTMQKIMLEPSPRVCMMHAMDVKATREAMGLSKTQLAEALGVNLSTVYRLEAGQIALVRRTELAIEALAKSRRVKPVYRDAAA